MIADFMLIHLSNYDIILQENIFEENSSFYSTNQFAQQHSLNPYLPHLFDHIYNLQLALDLVHK